MVGTELSQKPRRLQRFRNESSFARLMLSRDQTMQGDSR